MHALETIAVADHRRGDRHQALVAGRPPDRHLEFRIVDEALGNLREGGPGSLERRRSEDSLVGRAEERRRRPADQPFGGRIDLREAPVAIEHVYGHWRMRHQPPVVGFGSGEPQFTALPLRDVRDVHRQALVGRIQAKLVPGAERLVVRVEHDCRTTLDGAAVLALELRSQHPGTGLPDDAAEQLLARLPEDGFGGAVDETEPPVAIEPEEGVGEAVENPVPGRQGRSRVKHDHAC